jgi:PAS domain S-box-containing protein
MRSPELQARASELHQRAAALIEQVRGLSSVAGWLATLVEASDDAIIGKRLDGTIVLWNAAAERLYGYSADEAMGQPLSMLVPADRPDELSVLLDHVHRGERIERYQTRRRGKDGTLVDVALTIWPVRDEAGEVVGASAIVHDLTARRRLATARLVEDTRRAEAARDDAEEANRHKDEFLALLSHELRSPLNAIAVWLNALHAKGGDPVLTDRGLRTIERNTRLLARILDDLLDLSRIAAGRLTVERQRVEVVPLVAGVIETMRPVAVEKGITLESALEPTPSVVQGDPARLEQVIGNLVGNAIKFTPTGGTVEVSVQGRGRHVHVVVTDTGQGIPPDFLPYLFERFRQADTGVTRPQGGLGLGLALVRHLVELHGGTVEGESPGEGQGARFTVRLPLLKEADPV